MNFNRDFRCQVKELGNLVRGLEMIVEYASAHAYSGAPQILTPDALSILARLPRGRVPEPLLAQLCELMGINPADQLFRPEEIRGQTRPSNLVLIPLVEDGPSPAGLVREFWVETAVPYERAVIFPMEANEGFRRALTAGCMAAQRELEAGGFSPLYAIPHDYEFHVEQGAFGGNPRLHEQSAWLAAALSFFSLCGGLPIPGVVAATGCPDAAGEVGRLEQVESKIAACLRERPDVDRILVLSRKELPDPYRSHPKVRRVGSFVDALEELWGSERVLSPPKLNVYAAMDRAKHAYAKEHDVWGALARFKLIRRYLEQEPQISDRFRFRCDWRIASCYTHLGKPQDARDIFERWTGRAAKLWEDGIIDTEDYANLFASYGVSLQHLELIPEQTERMLREVLDEIERFRAPRLERARVKATLGNLLLRKREFEKAKTLLDAAYDLVDGEEKPKCCTFLCRLYVEWGCQEEARRYFDEFEKLNAEVTLPTDQQVNRWFNERVRVAFETLRAQSNRARICGFSGAPHYDLETGVNPASMATALPPTIIRDRSITSS